MKSSAQINATLKTLEARRNANRAAAAYDDAKANGYYTSAMLRDLLANVAESVAAADALEREEVAGMVQISAAE